MKGFENLQWYDYMRLVTSVLVVISAFRLCHVIRHRSTLGQTYTTRLRDFLWLLFAMFFAMLVGSIEAVIEDTDGRLVSLLFLAIALVSVHATRMSDDTLIT